MISETSNARHLPLASTVVGLDSNAITTYVPTVTFLSEKTDSSFAKALIRT